MHIEKRFEKAVEELYENNCYIAAEITKLGYPKLIPENSYPPTAGVGWDKFNKRIVFLFNEKFEKTLTDEEFKFVIAHEAVHVINMHVFLFKEEQERKKAAKWDEVKVFDHIRKLNVAADCVVNDSLIYLYNFNKLEALGTVNDKSLRPLYGEEVVQCQCHDLTVFEVFYLLPDKYEGEDADHDSWEQFFEADGSVNKDFIQKIKNFISGKIENSACSDKEQEFISKMKEAMINSKDKNASKAGEDAKGSSREISLTNNALNWNKILFALTDIRKYEDVWNKPNKKTISVYPDCILPSCKEIEKEKLFIAIDASGSINYDILSLFVSVLKNSPPFFKIEAISFDTQCYKYNISSSDRPQGGGGTAFNIVEEYILKNYKKYPKAVVVLTDGDNYDGVVIPKYANRWIWLLYGTQTNKNIKHMKCYNIQKLLK